VRVIEEVGKSGVIFAFAVSFAFPSENTGGGECRRVQCGQGQPGNRTIAEGCIYENPVAENSDDMLCGICRV